MTHGELDFYRSGHLDPHTPTGRRLAGGGTSVCLWGPWAIAMSSGRAIAGWSLWGFGPCGPEAPYAYAVLVQAWPQWALVWLPGLPDMLTYLSLYGNVGQGVRGGRGGAPVAPLERAFRAWHGHEVYGACEACDPDEVARLAQGKLPRWMEDPFRPPVVFQKWRLHLLT